MKHYRWLFIPLFIILIGSKSFGQGPPITADKPIMLGAKRKIVKTLAEYRVTETGSFTRIPLMLHYLPTSNTLIAIHTPLISYHFNTESDFNNKGSELGDIQILGKYQFYRKDDVGKTFRVVAKTLQTLPTGAKLSIDGISNGQYQSYVGAVAGYESIRYGVSNEIGFNYNPNGIDNELRYKLGFGLPLLKPVYPVNQVNLYFEYNSKWFIEREEYQLLYAQGVQYAKGQLTYEAAIQLPLIQEIALQNRYKYSILLGTRYVF